MKNTIMTDIDLIDITKEDLPDLSGIVSKRQENQQFMKFLKETPMTPQQNLEIFKKEFDTPNCMFTGIKIDGIQDIVGFLLFHCFNESKNEIEIGFRIDPLVQKKGICTQTVKRKIAEILSQNKVDSIIGRHSVWNRGSFGVFKKSGFKITDFVPQQTFLPNIGKITDDFKRIIDKNMLLSNNDNIIDNQSHNIEIIKKGLIQNDFIS